MAGIVSHLETAFVELGFGYVIDRRVGVDTIPDSERQAALAELREMGCEIEVLPDGRIRENLKTGALRQDIETIRQQMPRRFSLIKSLSGTRDRIEILAKSKEF